MSLVGIAYALCYDDRTVGGKNNIIILERVDGTLCKYITTLVPRFEKAIIYLISKTVVRGLIVNNLLKLIKLVQKP